MKVPLRVGVNGFGRIGRAAARIALARKNIQVAAINSRSSASSHAYLLKYDSTYGTLPYHITSDGHAVRVDSNEIEVFEESDPAHIPWKKASVDIVIEATGAFRTVELAKSHIQAGAKKVIVTAPAKDEMPTICLGVNEETYTNQSVISNASCTTNCFATTAKVLNDSFGIVRGFMTTTHSYTDSQNLLDNSHKKDLRLSRSAGLNLIPTETGASKALAQVLPALKGKIVSSAIRVPTPVGSLIDFVAEISKEASVEEINQAFKNASQGEMKGILDIWNDPIVSSDIKGTPYSSIVDAKLTGSQGTLINVKAWYDNEWGYATRLIDLCEYIGEKMV